MSERDLKVNQICAPMLRDMISRGKAVEMCNETWDAALESEAVKILVDALENLADGNYEIDDVGRNYISHNVVKELYTGKDLSVWAKHTLESFTKAKGG